MRKGVEQLGKERSAFYVDLMKKGLTVEFINTEAPTLELKLRLVDTPTPDKSWFQQQKAFEQSLTKVMN